MLRLQSSVQSIMYLAKLCRHMFHRNSRNQQLRDFFLGKIPTRCNTGKFYVGETVISIPRSFPRDLGQWSFMVSLIGGRYHIIPQLAIYKWYILPIGWLYVTYHQKKGNQETPMIGCLIYVQPPNSNAQTLGKTRVFPCCQGSAPRLGIAYNIYKHL